MSSPVSKRSRLKNMHGAVPICIDETESILETRSFDECTVTLASPVELNSRPNNNGMQKKIQHKRIKNESLEMECNGLPSGSAGRTRRKPTPTRYPSTYFCDGKRLIDFVLAYELKKDAENIVDNTKEDDEEDSPSGTSEPKSPQTHFDKRRIFEANLEKLGLELEYANSIQGNVKFVLIHAPFKVLVKQAELLMIRMPVHRNDVRKEVNLTDGVINAFLRRFEFLDFHTSIKKRLEPDEYFCQPFIAQHLECFVGSENPETFFSKADRARMVHDLLIRARYDRGNNMDKMRFGIHKLVRNGTYTAAYPVHEELNTSEANVDPETCTDRQLLYETWVKLKNLFKYQPLDLIQKYYGSKIAFYFSWLGYYTRCLYPVSLLGIICVIYGLSSMSEDIPSNDICSSTNVISREQLCPACDECDFIPLNSTCPYTKITYIFDNYATIVFAALMSIWTTLFLEGWKRYHAELAYKWNVLGFEPEEEVMRPEFQFRRKRISKLNPVTKQEEPYMPIMEKAFRLCGSGVTVIFFISLVLTLLVGIIVYRIIVRKSFYYYVQQSQFIQSKAIIITSATAALINLVFIMIMNFFYNKLALKLTSWECPRTQSEFDNSFTFKVFLFQFVNFYSSLFYIAFVKGRFAGVPGKAEDHADPHEFRIGEYRLEQCEASGCMVELVIQLAVIMVGKQVFNAFIEIAYPLVCNWFRRWRLKLPETKRQKQERINREKRKTIKKSVGSGINLYERDYMLNSVYQQFLFDEYLEMVIQLGFITLFVAAFPLAPLFALLNNILEIRLDAYKFIATTRRPVPQQARNIGIWLTIIQMISNISVLCNAFVIAFTSDFIPKIYYLISQGTLHGYVDDNLAYFDTSGLDMQNNATYCRFWDLRRPPCSLVNKYPDQFGYLTEYCSDNYEFNPTWWIILSMRLAFVLIFGLTVLSVKTIFAYLIPDIPTKIVIQLQRERYLMRQAILQRRDFSEEKKDETESTFCDIEQPRDLDRPTLANLEEWGESGDLNSVAYQPGLELPPEYRMDSSQSQHRLQSSDASNFDGFKKMFSNRERPSLSPRGSRLNLSVINIEDPDEKETSTSSETALFRKKEKPTGRWPSPNLLLVPSASSTPRRPKTVEVLHEDTM